MGNSSQQRLIAIATVVIIGLLGLIGYLLYNKVNQDRLIKQQSAELISTERLQASLEKEYYQALSDLEEMRGTNEELNALIDTQKMELKSQKERISSLLRTEADLGIARAEIGKLRTSADRYVAELEKLREEHAALTVAHTELRGQYDQLTDDFEMVVMEKEELTSAQAMLVSEREQLSREKAYLAEKVDIASVVRVKDIDVSGYRLRSSGREATQRRARNIDGLKICFTALDNLIADSDKERFFVRVVNPLGETMAMDEMGSGVLINSATNEAVRYSQYRDINYFNEESDVCMNWQPDLPFDPGVYTVEVYNKGYIAGAASFSLR